MKIVVGSVIIGAVVVGGLLLWKKKQVEFAEGIEQDPWPSAVAGN